MCLCLLIVNASLLLLVGVFMHFIDLEVVMVCSLWCSHFGMCSHQATVGELHSYAIGRLHRPISVIRITAGVANKKSKLEKRKLRKPCGDKKNLLEALHMYTVSRKRSSIFLRISQTSQF